MKSDILILSSYLQDNARKNVFNSEKFCTKFLSINSPDIKDRLIKTIEHSNVDYVLIVQENWNPKLSIMLDKILQDLEMKWIYITQFFNEIVVGPYRSASSQGCINCVFHRWFMTKKDRVDLFSLQSYLSNKNAEISNFTKMSMPTISLTYVLAELLVKEKHFNQVYILKKDSLMFKKHRFLANPHCEVCAKQVIDEKELIEIEFNNAFKELKLNKDKGYRYLSQDILQSKIPQNYLDTQLGIFNKLLDDFESPFSVSVANLPLKVGKDEVGVGRTNNYYTSHLTALLEGLERYCGMEPRYKKTNIFSSYNDIEEIAINPIELGLHTNEQYNMVEFPFNTYSPMKKMKWVWGYSLIQERGLLVPETYAYYGLNYRDSVQNGFVYEISNGCALGGQLIEATVHGLFEVIERDAFLISWYTKRPLKKIRRSSISNETINLMIAKFEYEKDYQLNFYDMTLDSQVPCILAVAKNNTDEGINILCAAGCNLDINKAIEGALHELCGILDALQKKFHQRKNELLKMSRNYSLVRSMEDHALLYGLKELESEFDFLLKNNGEIDIHEICSLPFTNNLYTDIEEILKQFKKLDLDIVVVDQTSGEIKEDHLSCVKVIVPGMLPMTFGHNMRRIQGFKRLYTIPNLFEYEIFDVEQLKNNIVSPHPFP
ncbi:TOMM precursor leader peptide-binding protein [Priestia megaterium]